MAPRFRISITLRTGETFSADCRRRPRHWKSAAMDLTPYGTDYRGARFKLERIPSAPASSGAYS